MLPNDLYHSRFLALLPANEGIVLDLTSSIKNENSLNKKVDGFLLYQPRIDSQGVASPSSYDC